MKPGRPPQLSTTSKFSDKPKIARHNTYVPLKYISASAQFTHRSTVVIYFNPQLKKTLASDIRFLSSSKDEKIFSPGILRQFPQGKPFQRDEPMKHTKISTNSTKTSCFHTFLNMHASQKLIVGSPLTLYLQRRSAQVRAGVTITKNYAIRRLSDLLGGNPPSEDVGFQLQPLFVRDAHTRNLQVPNDFLWVPLRSKRHVPSCGSQGCFLGCTKSGSPRTHILEHRARVHGCECGCYRPACSLGRRVYPHRAAVWTCYSGSVLCPEEFLARNRCGQRIE